MNFTNELRICRALGGWRSTPPAKELAQSSSRTKTSVSQRKGIDATTWRRQFDSAMRVARVIEPSRFRIARTGRRGSTPGRTVKRLWCAGLRTAAAGNPDRRGFPGYGARVETIRCSGSGPASNLSGMLASGEESASIATTTEYRTDTAWAGRLHCRSCRPTIIIEIDKKSLTHRPDLGDTSDGARGFGDHGQRP
jgi:hypothetical protein